jgi:TRAP-type C4-dicarboxylate transport system substrate-binding protein
MLKKALALVSVAVALGFAAPAHADDPVTLRIVLPGTTTTMPNWSGLWQLWINQVEADAGGALKLQPFFGNTLANFGNVYDRVVGGAADIGAAVQGSIGGKFPASTVVELPSDMIGREGAPAFWKLYQDGLIAAEYDAIKPLALFVYPQSFLSAQKPVTTLAAIKGLRIVTLTKANSEVITGLSAAPISASPPDVYEMLQRHTADGIVIGWLGLHEYKLAEVANYHLVAGLGSGGGLLMMNKDVYAKLPPQAKAAIDKNSGYAASQQLGADLDKIYATSEAQVRAMRGHVIAPLAAGDKDRYAKDVVQAEVDAWVKRIPNGATILAAYRAEAMRVRQGR